MKKINKLLIGVCVLDAAVIYTVVKRCKKADKILKSTEEVTNRKYTELKKNKEIYSERTYIDLETYEKKKAM